MCLTCSLSPPVVFHTTQQTPLIHNFVACLGQNFEQLSQMNKYVSYFEI